MSWLLSILGGIADLFQWVIGYGQRQIGKEQQQNEDDTATIEKLRAEADVAAQRVDAADELRNGKF